MRISSSNAGYTWTSNRSRRVRQPSEVTEVQVREQLDRARLATSAATPLLDPGAPEIIAHPGADAAEYSRAVVSAMGETGHSRSPEAAADVLMKTVMKLQG